MCSPCKFRNGQTNSIIHINTPPDAFAVLFFFEIAEYPTHLSIFFREWIEYYLEREIYVPLDNVAGSSVYFGAKNLMAYAQLCLVADELAR